MMVSMSDRTRFLVAFLLLLAVLIVFISPAVDLEPSALKALHMATLLFAALALAGTVLALGDQIVLERFVDALAFHSPPHPTESLLDLECSRLC